METRAHQTDTQSVQVDTARRTARVRIPRMDVETDYFLLEEHLLSEVCRRSATDWVIDLSDHQDGVTLVLAGILSGLCEEARRLGRTVRCTGLQKPCATCQTKKTPEAPAADRTVRENWIGLAGEQSSRNAW